MNLFLNSLYNLSQQSKLQYNQDLQLKTYETYNLDVKTIFEEFEINAEMWSKNEVKLKELFALN